MSYPTESLKEHPSTYFVQDRGNQEEITRLASQDIMLTSGLGGVLPELDTEPLQRVLDVGCGTGGWLIEAAKTSPTMTWLVGVDISTKVLSYARTQAITQQVDDRVVFQTMDVLRMLEFHKESFDLVHQRLGLSWLRKWDWSKLLLEYQRVTKSGGIIRITEPAGIESTSPALTTLCKMAQDAAFHSGRFFTHTPDGGIHQLVTLMTQHDIEDIQVRDSVLIYTPGAAGHLLFYEDMAYLFRVAKPFFRKWLQIPHNYEELYQQALEEMQQPDFTATWHFLTMWGNATAQGKKLLMRGLR